MKSSSIFLSLPAILCAATIPCLTANGQIAFLPTTSPAAYTSSTVVSHLSFITIPLLFSILVSFIKSIFGVTPVETISKSHSTTVPFPNCTPETLFSLSKIISLTG